MSHFSVGNIDVPQYWPHDPLGIEGRAAVAANGSDGGLAALVRTDDRALDGLCSTGAIGKVSRRRVCPCPVWKRVMDIAGAIVALAILSPFYLIVAVFIKCVSRGPVLYRQRRYGLGGRPFEVWKFRTIEVNHELSEHRSHVTGLMASDRPLEKRDHRLDIIRGGKLMRRFGIDELPQLINVVKGEMSLVGPRPDVVPFDDYAIRHRRRFDVLPGITGLWQVSGKNRTTFATMMRLDLAYVRRRSFWLDVTILLVTIPSLAWDSDAL